MLNQRKEFCSWRFMAILTSRGSAFHCAALTDASGLPRATEQLCYCGGLTGAKLLLAQVLARSPGGAFGVVLHCLGRTESVCRRWLWLLPGLVTPGCLSRSPCRVSSSCFCPSFLICLIVFALVWLQTSNLLKDQEALQSHILNLEVVCECPMGQWKAQLYLVS